MCKFRSCSSAITCIIALVSFGLSSNTHAADKDAAYLKYGCWQCHGTEGQGTVAGPKLGPDPIPYEGFSAFTRSTSGAMPPYREAVLPEQDLVRIHECLKFRPPASDTRYLLGK